MKKIIVIMLVFTTSVMYAGWEKTFGGEGNDFGNSIKQTNDGGLIIAGSTASFGSGNTKSTKGWLIKLDESGNKEWDYAFGNDDTKNGFQSIELTEDGGYLVGGFIDLNKMWLVKFNESGTIIWDSVYTSKIAASINTVRSTTDGEYIIGGFGEENVIKIDQYGKWIWSTKYCSVINDIQPMQDGSFVLAGENISIPQEFGYIPSPFIMKINAAGKTIWENPYGKEDLGTFLSVAESIDGGFIATGEKITKIDEYLFKRQSVVTKFDTDGKIEWEQLGIENSGGVAVELNGEDYIVAGSLPGVDGYPDNYVAKIGKDGIVKWDTSFGGDKYDYPSDVLVEKDGSIVTVGQTESTGEGFYDLQVVKIDSQDSSSPVEETGYPSQNYSVINYPNPFNISTTIIVNCDEVNPENIKMYMYAQTGIFTGSFEGFSSSGGIYSRTFNARELVPGSYYYKVFVGNKELTGKMVIQK